MSIYIGSNAGDTITPDLVSAKVISIGAKKPSAADDLILAGNGNDVVAGGGGNDIAFLGGGDDTFIWKSGDGNDIVDGGSGNDRLAFGGSSTAENIAVSAGILGLAQVTRSVGNVNMTLSSVERIDIAALDGQDRITVNDLSHTDVKDVFVNLAGVANPVAGDGQMDIVAVNGTASSDAITVALSGTSVVVSGLAATTTIDNADAVDQLAISGGNGNDAITAGNGLATRIQLTIDGGAGNDIITGGDGADLLLGGDGNDTINGGRGNDTAQLGAGDDTFVWNPGDGSDIVEGDAGTDTLQFNGSNAGENMVLSASGSHAVLTRDVAAITMDLHGMEVVNIAALGAVDNITISNLAGTGIKQVNVDLAAFGGGDDNSADTVTIAGTTTDDAFAFTVPTAGPAIVKGLGGEQVTVDHMGVGDRVAIDGGAGNDTVTANGTSTDDVINIARDGTDTVAVFSGSGPIIDVANVEHLVVQGGAGNDTIVGQNGIATLTQLTLDGGTGNDTLTGGDGADLLLGGDGNDLVNGARGNDTAQLGAGDDTFVWNPGDGSDIVEGDAGTDTLQFNGSNAGENMVLSASGSHAVLTRDVAAITMDLHGMEVVNIAALGAVDNITISNLAGTGIKQVNVDLAAFGGGDDNSADTVTIAGTTTDDAFAFTVPTAGPAIVKGLGGEQVTVDHMGVGDRVVFDGAAGNDTVTANGTGADDVIGIARDGTATVAIFSGSGPVIDIANIEHLVVQGGAGNDIITGQNGIGTLTQLTIDGGTGNDRIFGGDGNDTLLGGDGNDFVDGNIGSDTADLGSGDDVFGWDPGDGSDVVEGGSGDDTLQFNGSNASENIALSANGSHAVLTRNVANITMDLHGMENVNIRALGGVDNIDIGDLTGTDIKQVHVDLAAFDGSDDGSIDTVTVDFTGGDDAINLGVHAGPEVVNALGGAQVFVDNMGVGDHFVIDGGAGNDSVTASGTDGDDAIGVARNGTNVAVFADGGQAVDVTNVEQLLIEGGAGNDTITGQNGIATLTHLTIDGGTGNDTIFGGDGDDTLLGGDGNDVVNGARGNDTAQLGAGDDTFVWNPGDGSDIVEGNSGSDTLQFNGSNAGENMVLSASGSHALLTRDVAAITMDLHGMETVNIAALGAADNITVGDLNGTDVTQVNVDLGPIGGGGDGQIDTVTVNGTSGSDAITLSMRDGALVVGGLSVEVVIKNFDPNDVIHIAGLGGDDIIDASALGANGPKIVLDGGEGDDVLLGGAGDDNLQGGAGDDILIGGPGFDVLDGGTGDNVLIQDGGAAPVAASAHEFVADPHAAPEHETVAAVHTDHPLL
ncbi:MAG: calcium-binding protein [Betaproteobacteria bacterium]